MSKLASIQQQLERKVAATSPAVAPTALVRASQPTMTATRAPSREGKTHIGAYLPAGFKSSLRLVQAQTGEDTQTLISRALNELFRAHNVPVIDQS